jgi:hypothetical protein
VQEGSCLVFLPFHQASPFSTHWAFHLHTRSASTYHPFLPLSPESPFNKCSLCTHYLVGFVPRTSLRSTSDNPHQHHHQA